MALLCCASATYTEPVRKYHSKKNPIFNSSRKRWTIQVITWIQIQRDWWLDLSFYFSCIALQSFYLILLFYYFVSKHLINQFDVLFKFIWNADLFGRFFFLFLVFCFYINMLGFVVFCLLWNYFCVIYINIVVFLLLILFMFNVGSYILLL